MVTFELQFAHGDKNSTNIIITLFLPVVVVPEVLTAPIRGLPVDAALVPRIVELAHLRRCVGHDGIHPLLVWRSGSARQRHPRTCIYYQPFARAQEMAAKGCTGFVGVCVLRILCAAARACDAPHGRLTCTPYSTTARKLDTGRHRSCRRVQEVRIAADLRVRDRWSGGCDSRLRRRQPRPAW